MIVLIPVSSRGDWTVAEHCVAAARPCSRRRAGANNLQITIMLVDEGRDEGVAVTELVRIPLEPEERQEPERDRETREHRQIRPHARTADPRIY